MPAPQKVLDLVQLFDRNAAEYRAPTFNEANLRLQFVNPLFKALGWDMENEQGHAEAYKDVVHEASLKIGAATKAPDYCFRVGGTPKFYLEAKRPAVNIKEDPAPAFQLRRYAWSAKLPLSVLTDFEEFAVYDGRVRPSQADKASTARILYLRYTEFADRWDEIAGVFGRDAILQGSFDRYADAKKARRGTATVDAAFLEEIEGWREELAKNLAARNPKLSSRELNYAVQITIDRVIFLRMCEDRGIEPYGQLKDLADDPDVYKQLLKVFRQADDRYNSGLFHFEQEKDRPEGNDELPPGLKLDDKVLKGILKGLYYPDSPYEFSVLPAEILGQVYEQFLGKVIRLTAGHQAKVEEKPEVKKAGGVYYTPAYIVEYIVKHTVGKLLGEPGASATGVSVKEAARLRVLDPACGSGSFLLGAYRYLLDWHLAQYQADGPEKRKKEVFRDAHGAWRLTTGEKKRILLNNIYGVDIDPQAVEVTKLSLLLKVLEGETQETINQQRTLFHNERVLPDLGGNVKCGNSLIGPDFYEGQPLTLFDEEDRYRVNAFDWKAAFPAVMKAGGFDAVIGNPPWGQKEIADEAGIKQYVWSAYPSSRGIYDLFRPFVEKGVTLTRRDGEFGMVLPDIVLLKDYPETRRHMLDHLAIRAIDWWGMAFVDAVIDAATIVGTRTAAADDHQVRVAVHDPEDPFEQLVRQADFRANPRFVFNLHLTPEKRRILDALASCPKLGDFFEVHEGVHSGNIRADLFVDRPVDKTCRPLLFGRGEIQPYSLVWEGKYIRLGALPDRRTPERYANAGSPEWYDQDKVLVRRTGDYVLAAVDRDRRYASNNFFIVFPKQPCGLSLDGLCALLNSEFMTWYFRTIEPRRGRVFAELKIKHLTVFPLPPEPSAASASQELNRLGRERAELAALARGGRTPHEQEAGRRAQQALDSKINDLVRQAFRLAGGYPVDHRNGDTHAIPALAHAPGSG